MANNFQLTDSNFQDLFLDYGDSACGREGELSQIVDTNANNCNVMIQGHSFSDGELSLDNIQVDRKIFFRTGFFQFSSGLDFGAEFACPRRTYKTPLISAEVFWDLANSCCPGPNFTSTAISEHPNIFFPQAFPNFLAWNYGYKFGRPFQDLQNPANYLKKIFHETRQLPPYTVPTPLTIFF